MEATAARRIDTGTDELLCELRDRVAVINLNRPQARNALSDQLSPALREMIRWCGDEAEVGAVLITGAGTAFCAGGDVKGMGSASNPAKRDWSFEQRVADLQDRQRRLTGALVALRKPTLAALPGPAAGAGLSIALACDLRIAAQSALVATGYLKVGLSGDYGITWLLAQLVGRGRASELMLLGEKVDAQRCLSLGLFNRVVPDDQLRAEAFALARQLAQGPGLAQALVKDNLDDAATLPFDAALDKEAERLIRASLHPDHSQAVRAFVEKRAPNFATDRQ
jgi:enoyl-CoA hydratase/carnithine racemase